MKITVLQVCTVNHSIGVTCSVPTAVVAARNCMSMLVCSLTSEAVVGDLGAPHVVPGVAATTVVWHAFSFSTESWTAADHTRVDYTVGEGETIGTDREICENTKVRQTIKKGITNQILTDIYIICVAKHEERK